MIEDDQDTSENGRRDPRRSIFIISLFIVMILCVAGISLYFMGVIPFNDEEEDDYIPTSFLQVILHSNDDTLWINMGPEELHWNYYRVTIDGDEATLDPERFGSAGDIVVFHSSEHIIIQVTYNVKIIEIEKNMVVWEKDITSQY
ncbi:MAG: hypothetical protein KAH57_00880 [Thermoplasmata archaeon]|nr:hypothetical protein [Thermoplasmata archaeon]